MRGWGRAGGGVTEVERSAGRARNHLQPHLPAKREQSVTCSVHLSTCAAARRNTRGSEGEEMKQRKWLCRWWPKNVPRGDLESTPRLHLSIRHIKVHCSNVLFAKWTMAEFISLSRLFCFKYLSLRREWTLLSTPVASKHVSLPPTLAFICLCCPSLSSVSASLEKKVREIVPGTVIQMTSILFPLCLLHVFFFSGKAKSSATDKSGRSYLSNWLVIFSSAKSVLHVFQHYNALI